MSTPSLARFRTCKICGLTKPLVHSFFRSRSVRGVVYYRWSCCVCELLAKNEKRRANPEQSRAYARRYAAENKESRAQYRKDNAAANAKHSMDYAKRNPEKVREAMQRWRKRNPGRYLEDRHRRRARKQAAEHEPYTIEDINDLWHKQDGCCYYCDLPVFGLYHVDHKQPLSRGGPDKLENLAIACPFCNVSKKDKTEEEFADYRANI